MSRFLLARQAQRDLHAAIMWIGQDSARAARGLQAAVRDAMSLLDNQPRIGPHREDLAPPPLQFLALGRYPYILAYDATLDPPRVLRILHAARDIPSILSRSP